MASTGTIFQKEMYNAALNIGNVETDVRVDFKDFIPVGYFSLYVSTTGAGSVLKIQYILSFDGENFYIPRDNSGSPEDDIVTAHAPGIQIYGFKPPVAPYMKLKLTISTANASNVTVKLAIQ